MRPLVLALCCLGALLQTVSDGPARIQSEQLVNGRIAYSLADLVDIDGYATLAVRDPSGARKTTILWPDEGAGVYTDPEWSPEGTKIAVTYVVGNRYTGYNSDVFVANADGRGLHRLIAGPWGGRSWPTWSPDGTELAYVQGDEIWAVRADGSGGHAITTGFEPAWSPDGSKLALARYGVGDDTDLYVASIDGSGLVKLTDGPSRDFSPDWAPDGRSIVFQSATGVRSGISVIGVDGSGLRKLTPARYDGAPAWSPDGKKIVFVRRGDLWVMSSTGRGAHNITHTRSISKDESAPDWQPIQELGGTIHGTPFDDYLAGGPGDDVIVGGKGRDVMLGGPGNDTFYARDRRRDSIDGGTGRDRAFADPKDTVRRVERVRR